MAHHLYTAANADEITNVLKHLDETNQRLIKLVGDPAGTWLMVAVDQAPRQPQRPHMERERRG